MKKIIHFLFLLPFVVFAQQEQYSRVEIKLTQSQTLKHIANLGVCIDHGIHHKNKNFITELSESELSQLTSKGVAYKILVKDVVSHLHDNKKIALNHCDLLQTNNDLIIPEHFEYGTMSGYYTYEEMLNQLDSMRSLYPNLITLRDSLPAVDSVSTSHENRPLWMVKVSNNADVDEGEPEMIYTAIHHAREPGSLTQTIFYLWYLLENYGTNEQVTGILNNTELYFVPMINPDGYVYNQTIQPNGGGLWRKNRRDNGDGTFGVDLNRNYSYKWAFDDDGSSPLTNSQTYRGPSPGSEPEIKLITNFVDNHNFKFALNYHTFGGLLIYPWGFSDSLTPDSLEFSAFSEHMVSKNGYTKGTGTETVGYTVNGDSDDWYYGDTTHREAIYSMTPEAGNSFWPAQNEIIPFCNENLFPNLWMASYLLNYASVTYEYNSNLTSLTDVNIDFNLKRLGLEDSSDFILGFQNVNTSQLTVDTDSTISNLSHLEEYIHTSTFQFNSSVNLGDTITLEMYLDNGYYKQLYPIQFIYGANTGITPAYSNDLSMLGLWTGDWGLDGSLFSTPPYSIGDSPNTLYEPVSSTSIELDTVFDLTSALDAYVDMKINFDIENNYDYVQFSAVSLTDNQTYPLCGLHTNKGSVNQVLDEPLYDGKSKGWVAEHVSLEDLYGHNIKLKFELVSDNFEEGNGFNFDDFSVVIKNTPIGINELSSSLNAYPNPTSEFITLSNVDPSELKTYKIIDLTGKVVLSKQTYENTLSLKGISKGVYFLYVNSDVVKITKI